MRILYIYTDYFQNYDILWALLHTNHQIDVIDTPFITWDPDDRQLTTFEKKLSENHYDAVLNFGYVPYISDILSRLHIPYISWTYDSILHSLYNSSIENPYNFLFIFDKSEYTYLKTHFHIPYIYHLPLAVNTERVQSIPILPSDMDTYRADISFVGDLYQKNAYAGLAPLLSDEERAYFEQAFSYFSGTWGADTIYDWFCKEDADDLQARLPDDLKNTELMSNQRYFADILLSKAIAARERTEMLNLLARTHAVRLYTKRDADTSHLQNVECKGYLNYYDAMYKAFHYSRINLNITLHGMVSGIPLRCFDILGAGGFLLTNYQEELLEELIPDKEFVYYRSFEELAEKTDFYLRHEALRAAIAEQGAIAASQRHTYQQRIHTILHIFQKETSL